MDDSLGSIATLSMDYMRSIGPGSPGIEGSYWRYLDSLPHVPNWADHVVGSNLRFKVAELYGGGPYKAADYANFSKLPRPEQEAIGFIARYRSVTATLPLRYHLQEPAFPAAEQWGMAVDGKQPS